MFDSIVCFRHYYLCQSVRWLYYFYGYERVWNANDGFGRGPHHQNNEIIYTTLLDSIIYSRLL